MNTYYSIGAKPWSFHALSHLFFMTTLAAGSGDIQPRDKETGYQTLHTSFWIKNQSLRVVVGVACCLGNKVCFLSPVFTSFSSSSTQRWTKKQENWSVNSLTKSFRANSEFIYTSPEIVSQVRPAPWLMLSGAGQCGRRRHPQCYRCLKLTGCPSPATPLMYHGDALGHMELSPPLKTAFSRALAWQRGSKWPLESLLVVDNLHLYAFSSWVFWVYRSVNWEMPIRWELFNIINVSLCKKRNCFYKDQL